MTECLAKDVLWCHDFLNKKAAEFRKSHAVLNRILLLSLKQWTRLCYSAQEAAWLSGIVGEHELGLVRVIASAVLTGALTLVFWGQACCL